LEALQQLLLQQHLPLARQLRLDSLLHLVSLAAPVQVVLGLLHLLHLLELLLLLLHHLGRALHLEVLVLEVLGPGVGLLRLQAVLQQLAMLLLGLQTNQEGLGGQHSKEGDLQQQQLSSRQLPVGLGSQL
jgi:hypothetical protein